LNYYSSTILKRFEFTVPHNAGRCPARTAGGNCGASDAPWPRFNGDPWTYTSFREESRRTRNRLREPPEDTEECNILRVRGIKPNLVGGMAGLVFMQQIWDYMEVYFGMPARALRRYKEDIRRHGMVPEGDLKGVRERYEDLAAWMGKMMCSGSAHLWATQEIYNICLKKLSATEKKDWQDEHGRQPTDNKPWEFFMFMMDWKILEPTTREPTTGRPLELAAVA
jgi:hypothetical protein